MNVEEKIKQELEEKFGYLKDAITIKRGRRIFADVPLEKFAAVFDYAVKQMRFEALSAITGMDAGGNFAVIYHLNRPGESLLNLRVNLNKEEPEVNTVTAHFPGADIYERELVDLLGIKVNGLSAGSRYPLPDNWPKDEFPLRKSWHAVTTKSEVQNA